MDDVEGVGHRWAEEGLGAERTGDRAERAKRWAERWVAERTGDRAKASISLNEDMDVALKMSLADKSCDGRQGGESSLRLRAS